MTGEICMFHKYGFCKNGDKCKKSHLKEVCLKWECDSKKCNKRHPRPCKYLSQNGHCKFDSKCSYSHRQPKMIEDQNLKIEALERMIQSQNETINELRVKMLQHQRRELDQLQSQINLLKSQNTEKESLIKKLDSAVKDLKEKHVSENSEKTEDVDESDDEEERPDRFDDEMFTEYLMQWLGKIELFVRQKVGDDEGMRKGYFEFVEEIRKECEDRKFWRVTYDLTFLVVKMRIEPQHMSEFQKDPNNATLEYIEKVRNKLKTKDYN